MDGKGADQPGFPVASRQEDEEFAGIEDRLGDLPLESLEVESDPLSKVEESEIPRVYASLGLLLSQRRHLCPFRVTFEMASMAWSCLRNVSDLEGRSFPATRLRLRNITFSG